MADAPEDDRVTLPPMIGWVVAVTSDRDTALECRLLHELGARTLAPPARPVGRSGNGAGTGRRFVEVVTEGAVDAVTVTSVDAVARLVELAEAVGRSAELTQVTSQRLLVVALDDLCAAAVIAAGWGTPLTSPRPTSAAMTELLAAYAARRRRSTSIGDVELLLDATDPVIDGAVVPMGARERGVFDVLTQRPGAVVPKEVLRRQVWSGRTGLHTVEVTVGRLRDRLAATAGDVLQIQTVPRRGYRLIATASAKPAC